MKKGILAVAFIFLLMGKMSFAHEHEEGYSSMWTLHSVYIEPRLEAFIPFNDNIDTALFVGGDIGYEWNEWWEFFISIGWAESDLDGDIGDVSIVPLLFNARFNLWPGVYMVDPYVFGGIGISFNDITINGVPGADIDNDVAAQFGVGADYWINEQLTAGLKLTFFFHDPNVSPVLFGEDDIELNALQIGGNIKWRF